MQAVIELITKIRNIRAEMQIKPSEKLTIHIAADTAVQTIFAENEAQILKLAASQRIAFERNSQCSESLGQRSFGRMRRSPYRSKV